MQAIQSIQIGTMIQTGAHGRWNAPQPVDEILYRGNGVNGEYVGVRIANTTNLRDGKVWSWTSFGINEIELAAGTFVKIADA